MVNTPSSWGTVVAAFEKSMRNTSALLPYIFCRSFATLMNSKPVSLISEDWNCRQQCLKSLSIWWLSRWRKIFEKENVFHNFAACACKENWHVIFRQLFVSLIVDRWSACLPIEWHPSYYECWQISTIYMIFRNVQSNYRCRARISLRWHTEFSTQPPFFVCNIFDEMIFPILTYL